MILEDEFLSFLRENYGYRYNEKMVTVPGLSFQYKLPGNQHGIPSKAKEIRQKKMAEEKTYEDGRKQKARPSDDNVVYMRGGKQMKKEEKTESVLVHSWQKAAAGQFAEQRVYAMLQKRFSNGPCVLVHGYKENDLVKVIKENIDKEKRENPKNTDLTQRELKFFKITNRHFHDIDEQITKMMDAFVEDRFFENSIPNILEKMKEDKPGFKLMTESNKTNYEKNIKTFLEKKFKDGAQYTKSKLKDIILEHFLNLTYPNSEFDLLLFLKVICRL